MLSMPNNVLIGMAATSNINGAVIGADFNSVGVTFMSQAAAPTFSPAPGNYQSAQNVTVSSATAGASIYYTTDGSTPSTSSTLYSGAIAVSSTTTIKAIAHLQGMADSAPSSAAYIIGAPAATPTFSPAAGTYAVAQSVTIATTTSGASIRYTTNGSTPSETAGTLYSGPVTVSSSMTLKAIAYETGFADSAVASASYTIAAPASNTAVFVKNDATTQGSWMGVYGANGYNVIDSAVSYPGYVAVTPANQVNYVWAASTTDPRALQQVGSSNGIAAAWYNNNSFTVDLIFTDGATHQLAVYCLDWDGNGARAETLSITDGATGAVLDTRNVSSFQNGQYLVWTLSGHVVLNVTHTAGDNAVISGLFFDPP
jgi:hypothetical protein